MSETLILFEVLGRVTTAMRSLNLPWESTNAKDLVSNAVHEEIIKMIKEVMEREREKHELRMKNYEETNNE